MPIVKAAPEFRTLSEAQVQAALNDPDASNPIAHEVARLIAGYIENFSAHVDRLGYFPSAILRHKPETAIEAIAMRLTTQSIQDSVAAALAAENED